MKQFSGLLFIALLAPLLFLGCTKPKGVSFDENLYSDDSGIVRWKKDGSIFSGETFALLCEECTVPLLNHWPVHFVGNYKNGIPHGTFWIAKSGRQDDYFEYKKKHTQLQIQYQEGKHLLETP